MYKKLKNVLPTEWSGYSFSDEEIELMLKGKEIEIITGDNKSVIGRLEKGIYKGKVIWSYKIGIPKKTAGHEWTPEEREKLYNGETLSIETESNKGLSQKAFWDSKNREVVLLFADQEE